ncbi:MAG: hypothetical protein AABX47_10400 [Nanoarchaeota archaeon]
MWFNDWLDVKKSGKSLFLYTSFRSCDDPSLSIGPVITPYPTPITVQNPYPPGGSSVCGLSHSYPTEFIFDGVARSLADKLRGIVGEDHVRLVGTTDVYEALMKKAGVKFVPDPYHKIVVQLYGIPHETLLSLPDVIRDLFIQGKYAFQANCQLGYYRKASLHPVLEEVAPVLKEVNEVLFSAGSRPAKYVKSELSYAARLAGELTKRISSIDPKASVAISKKTRQARVCLPDLTSIEFLRSSLTTKELLALPMRFLDTEQKFYAYSNSATCMIGSVDKRRDGGLEGKIFTTEETAQGSITSSFNGRDVVSEMVSRGSEMDIVEVAARSFKSDSPAFLVAQHVPHDLTQLRKVKAKKAHKGFPVGVDRADPRKDVSIKFFTRMKCPGMMILDTMRVSMILDPYLPAHHLEMITGLEKMITYQRFDQLCRDGDPQGLRHQYLVLDVLSMAYHVLDGPWKGRLGFIFDAARELGVSVTDAAFSPACAKKHLDWQYFQDNGTYREHPKYQFVLRRAELVFRDKHWPSLLGQALFGISYPQANDHRGPLPEGVYDAQRVYIPLGKAMIRRIAHKVPCFSLHNKWDSYSGLDRIALCQYLNVLTQEPWLHISMIDSYMTKADLISAKVGIKHEHLRLGDAAFWKEYKRCEKSDPRAIIRLISKACPPNTSFYKAKGAFDSVLKARKAEGRFYYRHGFSVSDWKGWAKEYGDKAGSALAEAGCEVVARDRLWLYLRGSLPERPPGDLIPLDRVRLFKFVKQGLPRVIFKERGVYHGIKLDPGKPKARSIFESRALYDIFDAIIDQDIAKAQSVYNKGLEDLAAGVVPKKDLMFKPRKPKKIGDDCLDDGKADGEDGAQTKMPELSPDQGKAEHGLVGLVDGCAEFFSYNECENGLERFKPDIDAYVSRYKAKVGYWLRKGVRILKAQARGNQERLF